MDLKFPLQINELGRLVTVETYEETEQRIYIRVSSQKGEWAFDTSFGVPWIEIMRERPFNRGAARALILAQLLKVPGVDKVVSLTLTQNTDRTLYAVASVVSSGVPFEVAI